MVPLEGPYKQCKGKKHGVRWGCTAPHSYTLSLSSIGTHTLSPTVTPGAALVRWVPFGPSVWKGVGNTDLGRTRRFAALWQGSGVMSIQVFVDEPERHTLMSTWHVAAL